MENEKEVRTEYAKPAITDFGKVSLVTAAVGMTFLTDAAFTGSMFDEQPGMGMAS